MSDSLAIGAVTATLRSLLDAGIAPEAGGVQVTTLPPDRAQIFGQTDGAGRINIFLYHTQINAAWRNMDLPRQIKPNETGQPPLALDLYYLLSAHEKADGDTSMLAHRLLGRAMRALHDHPLLGADEIRAVLPASDLADQIERVRITPQPLSIDDISKLWMIFQTAYRISAAYQVSVVLIESTRPSRTPLPVLRRGEKDRGPSAVAGNSLPILEEVRLPNSQSSALLGDELIIVGQNLGGLSAVRFTLVNPRLSPALSISLPPAAVEMTTDGIKVTLPDDPAAHTQWLAGFYSVAVVVDRMVDAVLQSWSSNELPLSLAPRIESVAPNPTANGNVTLTLTCTPEVKLTPADGGHMRFDQQVMLLLGTARQIAPQPPPDSPLVLETTGNLTFTFFVPAEEAGEYLIRLRVDGVDLPLVDRTVSPPQFDATQKLQIT